MISRTDALRITRSTAEARCKRICKVKAKVSDRIMWEEYRTGKLSHWRAVNIALFDEWNRNHWVARGNLLGGRFTF